MSDYARALTDFWSAQGQAMLRAQEQASLALTEGMQALISGKFPGGNSASPELAAGVADLAKAGEAVAQLWTAASALSSELANKLAKFSGAEQDSPIAAVLRRIADPRQWMTGPSDLDEALGRLAEGPRLADLWDLERRYARVMQSWAMLRRRSMDHSAVMLDAWVKAGKQFAEEIGKTPGDGSRMDARRAMSLWTDLANRILLQTQRSERFLDTQREMVRAATDLRLAQQDLVEHFGKQYGFPTRSELDDVHRTLTEMRREMRRLRRAGDRSSSPAPVLPRVEHAGATPRTAPHSGPEPEHRPETVAALHQEAQSAPAPTTAEQEPEPKPTTKRKGTR